jgi:hypothetical protein
MTGWQKGAEGMPSAGESSKHRAIGWPGEQANGQIRQPADAMSGQQSPDGWVCVTRSSDFGFARFLEVNNVRIRHFFN